jgi:nucleoside-specific outer membrane channel protein Tsx
MTQSSRSYDAADASGFASVVEPGHHLKNKTGQWRSISTLDWEKIIMTSMGKLSLTLASISAIAFASGPAHAADWSETEILFNHGTKFREPFNPFNPGDGKIGASNDTDVTKSYFTLQHASSHSLGRNFFFVDFLKSEKNDPQNGGSFGEVYGEWYTSLSFSKLSGTKLEWGIIRDINLTGGINYGAKNNGPNPRILLLGPTVDFNVPGFIFFNVDFLAYKDTTRFSGNPSVDETTWQITPSWLSKFNIGPTKWSFTGHIDWIGKRCLVGPTGCNGRAVETVAQPEIRLDVGNFVGKPDVVFIGMKYNYWKNKYGYDGLTERNPQIQLDWKF